MRKCGPADKSIFSSAPFFQGRAPGLLKVSLLGVALNGENPAGNIVAYRAVEGFPVF